MGAAHCCLEPRLDGDLPACIMAALRPIRPARAGLSEGGDHTHGCAPRGRLILDSVELSLDFLTFPPILGRALLCPLVGTDPAPGSIPGSVGGPPAFPQTLSGPPLAVDFAGLSSDSGLGGSSDGSSDVLAFGVGSVVDRVAEEGECAAPHLRPCASPAPGRFTGPDRPVLAEGAESEESSGEADGEAETWGLADVRELHPGLLAHRAARTRDLPALAAALAHGAEVNWADAEDEGKTPLVQAVLGVSRRPAAPGPRCSVFTAALPWCASLKGRRGVVGGGGPARNRLRGLAPSEPYRLPTPASPGLPDRL